MENKIFVEAESNETAECFFLKAILNRFFPDKLYRFIPVAGIGNFKRDPVKNQVRQAISEGDAVLILVDADSIKKSSGGYQRRYEDIKQAYPQEIVKLFIYPNNCDDGDVETLMLSATRRDIHQVFFDCYEDYEHCVKSVKDQEGNSRYNIPNLKGKLFTYISAQPLSNSLRRNLGRGDWLFDNDMYWDLSVDTLRPLIEFFKANLQ